jgi:hypothetical protein
MKLWNNTPTKSYQPATPAPAGPLLAMRVWLAGSPWRLTGAWMVLAAAFVVGGLEPLRQTLLDLLLAILLADPLWQAMWAQIAERSTWPSQPGQPRPLHLPYVTAQGPAGHPRLQAAVIRDMAPLLAVALLVAWLLGIGAIALTLIVGVLAGLGWLCRRAGQVALVHWLQAVVQLFLPFYLGVHIAGGWPDAPLDLWLLALVAGYTLLGRAGLALSGAGIGPLALAGLGTVVLVGLLLVAGLPLAAGVVGLLLAAPLLLLAQPRGRDLAAAQTWWWAAGLVSALAMGLGIG